MNSNEGNSLTTIPCRQFVTCTSDNTQSLMLNLIHTFAGFPQESGSGRTALHFAIESGSLPMATSLVTECEVEVDVPTYSGYTPLHMAAGGDKKELVAYLIAMGADPYMQTDEEEMPEDLTQDSEVSGVSNAEMG